MAVTQSEFENVLQQIRNASTPAAITPQMEATVMEYLYQNSTGTAVIEQVQTEINGIKSRLATAESNISDHGTKINLLTTTVNSQGGNITALQGRMNTAEGNISSQGGRIGNVETDVDDLQEAVEQHTSDISNHSSTLNTHTSAIAANKERIDDIAIYPFDEISELISANTSDLAEGRIVWNPLAHVFLIGDSEGKAKELVNINYQSIEVHEPLKRGNISHIFRCGGKLYHFVDLGLSYELKALADASDISELQDNISANAKDIAANAKDIAANAEKIAGIAIFPFDFIIDHQDVVEGKTFMEAGQIMWATSSHRFFIGDENNKAADYVNPEYQKADGVGADYKWLNTRNIFRLGGTLYHATTDADGYYTLTPFADASDLEALKEKVSAIGNCYNVTNTRRNTTTPRPTEEGTSYYDELATAIAYTYQQGKAALGMQITFALAANSWKTYQYVGTDTTEANFKNSNNWVDLAGLSAGTEPMVNLNVLMPTGGNGGNYGISSALVALKGYEDETGITYRKKNLVITYRTAFGKSETKQYAGDSLEPEVFFSEANWKDFGGGAVESVKVNGTEVKPDSDGVVSITIPEPTVDETLDEYSDSPVTNAAITQKFNNIAQRNITAVNLVGDADSGYTMQFVNAADEVLEEIDLPATSGGGGGGDEGTDTARIVLRALIGEDELASEAVATIREGSPAYLIYQYGHQYSTGEDAGQDTGAQGYITVTVKNGITTTYEATYPSQTAGQYTVDLSNILRNGNNSVTVKAQTVDPNTGRTQQKTVTVNVAVRRLSMSSGYNLQNSINNGGYSPADTIVIPFSCAASGKKDIHVIVDGVADASLAIKDYSATTGEIRIAASSLTVGRHNVQIYATQVFGELQLQSETLFIDILRRADSVNFYDGQFVGVKMTLPSGVVMDSANWQSPLAPTTQYAQFGFDFVAYDGGASPVTVGISHDGVQTSTVSTAMVVNAYSYRFTEYTPANAPLQLGLTVGTLTYVVRVQVAEAAVDIAEVKDSVLFSLSAQGRSNSEANPAQWTSNGVTSTFDGFDWQSDGWQDGVLRLTNGATVDVAAGLLNSNAAVTGLTFEAEVKCSSIIDRSGAVIDCMNALGRGLRITTEQAFAAMSGADESVETKFAAETWVRVGVTVSRATDEQRLLSLYINGVRDRAVKFAYDSTMQNTLSAIRLLSDSADVDVRMLRAYSRCLTDDEMLANYIAGRTSAEEMITLYERNNVLDSDASDIDMATMAAAGKGVLRVIGDSVTHLSALDATNNKSIQMRVTLEFTSPYGRAYDFRAVNAIIQIQGTSSTTYPRKNYDITFDDQTELYVNGVLVEDGKYAFKPGARPVSIYCLKADFCDSSGTHNCGAVKLVNDTFKACGWLTPPQQAYSGDYDVRIGIDSFPITLYNDDSGTGQAVFVGKYNFNNEKKGSGIVYGFEGIEGYNDAATLAGNANPCICLEFLENGKDLALFKNADFDTVTNDKTAFDAALEFRFPTTASGGKIKWAGASEANKTAIRRLWGWVVACKGNPAKFLAEAGDYFGGEGGAVAFAHYVMTDYLMAVDDRAKNMMLATWDGLCWYFLPYDWDCLFGLANTSHLKYNYDIDETSFDTALNNYAFAGHDSELWSLVRACPDKLKEVAEKVRTNMTTEIIKAAFSTEFEEAWSERVYNRDEAYKYITPAFAAEGETVGGVSGNYLFALQGSRKTHREYIIKNRCALLDALYGIGDFRGNAQKVYLRGDFATDPKDIGITAAEKFAFGYGSINNTSGVAQLVKADAEGDSVTLTVHSNLSANDPQNIYGADRIKCLDLTDIAAHLVSTLDFTNCTRLEELDLTTATDNTALSGITTSICRVLRSLRLNGIKQVATLDLSKNRKLEELICDNTNVRSVTFATGAAVTKAALPATIETLTMTALPNIVMGDEGLSAVSWQNLQTLNAANLGKMNPVSLLVLVLNSQDEDHRNLQRVKVGGVEVRGSGSELLELINRGCQGVDTTRPQVLGVYQITDLANSDRFDEIEAGIEGITLVVVIDAYISVVNEVNAESYAGITEVEDITTDNIGELALQYYNGETYEEWLERYAEENANINSIID